MLHICVLWLFKSEEGIREMGVTGVKKCDRMIFVMIVLFFFFKQKTAYEITR